jgi:hypothetical protein
MSKYLLTVILNLSSIGLYSQGYSTTDSILNNQVQATSKIYREIRLLTEEISDLAPLLSKKDSGIVIATAKNINRGYDSISNQIANNEGAIKYDKKGFNFWDFLSGAIAEMIGAFIGAGAALWIFFKQTKEEKVKENLKEQIKLNEKNHYFGSLLQSSLNLAKQQNEGIKKFYEELDSKPLYIPLIAIHPKQDLERLSKVIDNEEYYHAFLNKYGSDIENVKKYRGIAGSVDFLNSQINQMLDMQSKGQNFDHKRKVEYKELLDTAIDTASELGMRNENTNPDLTRSIGEILQRYYEGLTNPLELEYHQKNLVEPLITMMLNNFSDLPEVRQFLNDLKNATLIYSEIQGLNKIHSDGFKGFHNYINQAIELLEKNGKELIKEFQNEKNTATKQVQNGQFS